MSILNSTIPDKLTTILQGNKHHDSDEPRISMDSSLEEEAKMQTICGTPKYAAPEIFQYTSGAGTGAGYGPGVSTLQCSTY